jgi:hypothetical protein
MTSSLARAGLQVGQLSLSNPLSFKQQKCQVAPQAALFRSTSSQRHSRRNSAPARALESFTGMRKASVVDGAGARGVRHADLKAAVAASLETVPVQKQAGRRGQTVAMFERFTEKAIKVIMLAQEEARRLGHNFVGTEQILLGLIGEGTGIAAKVLKSLGVNLKEARVEVEKIIGRGSGFVAVEIPFTPRAKRVLELSLEEARQLGKNIIAQLVIHHTHKNLLGSPFAVELMVFLPSSLTLAYGSLYSGWQVDGRYQLRRNRSSGGWDGSLENVNKGRFSFGFACVSWWMRFLEVLVGW